MFGGGLFQTFENDPFFEESPFRMRPFNMADPFGMFERHRALTGPQDRLERDIGRSNALARRNDMMWPFGRSPFDSMFERFESMANDPNAHTFSSSTVMSYSNGPDGNPQVYRASKSTRTGPGGVKETRRQVQDSVSGMQKMSVGHQIGDKSHTIGRSYNSKTNEEVETMDFVNLDEDESEMFEREWDQKIHSYNHHGMLLGGRHHQRPMNQPALSSKPYHSQDYEEATALPHKERKKEKFRHHQGHFDGEDNRDHAARTRPHHSHVGAERDTQYQQHASTDVYPECHHQQGHSKPKGLRASKRNIAELDAGHHQGRPKAPGVGHRSKPPKSVNFSDDSDSRPVRKQSHHYSQKSASNHLY